jgi:hypothetical protein
MDGSETALRREKLLRFCQLGRPLTVTLDFFRVFCACSSQFSFNWRDAAPAPMAAFIASSSASLATQPIGMCNSFKDVTQNGNQ